jgi:hypothetical protein
VHLLFFDWFLLKLVALLSGGRQRPPETDKNPSGLPGSQKTSTNALFQNDHSAAMSRPEKGCHLTI